MKYEQAVYYKLLLTCGYRDELDAFIDNALLKEDPISRLILDLSLCMSDDKKTLDYLGSYIAEVPDS